MNEASFSQNLVLTVFVLLAIYYIVANVFCFYAYRQFKHSSFDRNGGGGNFGMTELMNRRNGQRAAERQEGSGNADAPPAGQQSSSGGGGFKSFQGKGV